jgi:hypothetical protein
VQFPLVIPMNKLMAELERLYFFDGQQGDRQKPEASGDGANESANAAANDAATDGNGPADEQSVALNLLGADGMVRALVVGFCRSGDWALAATLYQAVQNDLSLPAPAVAVSGSTGYWMIFSLAEPVPHAKALTFLDGLRRNYLFDLPEASLTLRPDSGAATLMTLPPSQLASGKWSAFIDPAMGGLFFDEPWLEMAPNNDRQADILAGLESITGDDFATALSLLQAALDLSVAAAATRAVAADHSSAAVARPARRRSLQNVGSGYSDPQSFLLAVMNDPSASARHRIAAARALLPVFGRKIVA